MTLLESAKAEPDRATRTARDRSDLRACIINFLFSVVLTDRGVAAWLLQQNSWLINLKLGGLPGVLIGGNDLQQATLKIGNCNSEVGGLDNSWNELAVGADDAGGHGRRHPTENGALQHTVELSQGSLPRSRA